jgi:RNA polymerase sigma-70 factor (ECF subfamily)
VAGSTGGSTQTGRNSMDDRLKDRFEVIALPHLDAVYRMARVLASDIAEAEDLVQETFVRAFRAFGGFELRDYGAKPWLLRILHNTFYTLKSKQRRDPVLLGETGVEHLEADGRHGEAERSAATQVDWDHMDAELKLAVDRLRPEYRTALLLWAIEELSYKEIATVCDCALGTVMSRLHRARREVRRTLSPEAQNPNLNRKDA